MYCVCCGYLVDDGICTNLKCKKSVYESYQLGVKLYCVECGYKLLDDGKCENCHLVRVI